MQWLKFSQNATLNGLQARLAIMSGGPVTIGDAIGQVVAVSSDRLLFCLPLLFLLLHICFLSVCFLFFAPSLRHERCMWKGAHPWPSCARSHRSNFLFLLLPSSSFEAGALHVHQPWPSFANRFSFPSFPHTVAAVL